MFIQLALISVSLFAAPGVRADTLPSDIRIVVPVTAGSSLDARARVIAEALGQRIKQRVIIDNRPGAGGTIGALATAKARADGSTLLFTNNSHVISPHIYPKPGYDVINDFTPITKAYVSGMVLVVHPVLQVRTLKELVALASGVSTLSYASSGNGSVPHLATELFKHLSGANLLHVPYRGDGQALSDVLAGRVPVMMSGYVVAAQHINTGKLRALAVTSARRSNILPGVPTFAEAGYPDYALETWTGFFAPSGTPTGVIALLNREIAAALAMPSVQAHLLATGAESAVTSPAEFAAFIRKEWESYGKLATTLNLTTE